MPLSTIVLSIHSVLLTVGLPSPFNEAPPVTDVEMAMFQAPGSVIETLKGGQGRMAKLGERVAIRFTIRDATGAEKASSVRWGSDYQFVLEDDGFWNLALYRMRVGERRRAFLPNTARGANLDVVVELIQVASANARAGR